jgi:hypothetical protein
MYPEDFIPTIQHNENEARRQRNREARQRKRDKGMTVFCIGFVIGMALVVIFF